MGVTETDLRATQLYVRDIRSIECKHAHPGPDEACARCQIDAVLSGRPASNIVHRHFDKHRADRR